VTSSSIDSDETKTAQGVYVVVAMTIQNIGNRSQGFFADNQTLKDSEGRQFSADSYADILINGDNDGADINPGNQVRARAVFDVPEGTQPAQIVLHDSAYSGGVTVNLSPPS
jgi:Domain of unknown function (DUF4352)